MKTYSRVNIWKVHIFIQVSVTKSLPQTIFADNRVKVITI